MLKLARVIFFLTVSFNSHAFEKDLSGAFGLDLDSPLPSRYLKESNKYPTRIVRLNVPADYELKIFSHIELQIIESSKMIYSLTAEKEMDTGKACKKEIRSLFGYFDKKYKNLKVSRSINVDGKSLDMFDGYLSSDGKRKLSVYCSLKPGKENEILGVSIWDNELKEQAESLWSKISS